MRFQTPLIAARQTREMHSLSVLGAVTINVPPERSAQRRKAPNNETATNTKLLLLTRFSVWRVLLLLLLLLLLPLERSRLGCPLCCRPSWGLVVCWRSARIVLQQLPRPVGLLQVALPLPFQLPSPCFSSDLQLHSASCPQPLLRKDRYTPGRRSAVLPPLLPAVERSVLRGYRSEIRARRRRHSRQRRLITCTESGTFGR